MILRSFPLSETELTLAKRATKDRAKTNRLRSRCPRILSDRVSTFPPQFEVLRDRLVEQHPHLSVASIENMVFTLTMEYPFWFGSTSDADEKAHTLKRDHDITHGLIQAAPLTENQRAALARRKEERMEREQRIAARVSCSSMTP